MMNIGRYSNLYQQLSKEIHNNNKRRTVRHNSQ